MKIAAALQRYVHAGYRFRCDRIHNDGTIALPHVTCGCSPVVPSTDHFGYRVRTDLHRSTGVQPQG